MGLFSRQRCLQYITLMTHMRYNVLIVNTSTAVRSRVCTLLAPLDLRIIEVDSGEDAAAALLQNTFQLVIADTDIGILNGWKLVRLVRSGLYRTSAQVPVILTSDMWNMQVARSSSFDIGRGCFLPTNQLHHLPSLVLAYLRRQPSQQVLPRLLFYATQERLECLIDDELRRYFDVDIVSGLEAFKTEIRQREFDLVLVDDSPELLSDAFLQDLKQLHSSASIFIALLRNLDRQRIVSLLGAGFDDFLRVQDAENLHLQCAEQLLRYDYLDFDIPVADDTGAALSCEVFHSLPLCIIVIDRTGEVVLWNLASERFTGIIARDAIGQPLKYFKIAEAIDETVTAALSKNEAVCRMKVSYQRDDSKVFLDISVSPMPGNEQFFVVAIGDVSGRVLAEERAIRSGKMISLGNLAAGLAHEINNPLAGIMQNAQVLKNRLLLDSPANLRVADELGLDFTGFLRYLKERAVDTRLDAVMESGAKIAHMIENMLSFGRRGSIEMTTVDLADLLDRAVELTASSFNVKESFDFHQIEIARDYASGITEVDCNASQIQQVFIHILTNGAQVMSDALGDNPPVLDPPRFILRIKQQQDYVAVEIEDNGPGLDIDAMADIFEPFYSDSRKSQKTGLGLTICYYIVCENHHGDLLVDSTIDRGSVFVVKLPVQQ